MTKNIRYMVWYKSDGQWKSDFGLTKDQVQKLMDSLPPADRVKVNAVGYHEPEMMDEETEDYFRSVIDHRTDAQLMKDNLDWAKEY